MILEKNSSTDLLKIGRVRVHYSILQLLRGRFENSVKEISIVKSRLVIDVEKDRDILDLAKSLKGDSSSGINLPEITVSGKNLSVIVKRKDSLFILDKFFFSITGKNSDIVFSSKGYVKAEIKNTKLSSADSRFKFSGVMINSMYDFNSRLSLKSISTNLFSLGSLSLQLKKDKDIVLIRKIEDSSPLDMEITYDIGKGDINLTLISERFKPSRYFHGVHDNRIIKDWVNGIYTADFTIGYSIATGSISYSGKMDTFGDNDLFKGKYRINTELSGNSKLISFNSLKVYSTFGNYYYKGRFNINTLLPTGTLTVRKGKYRNNTFSSTVYFSSIENNLRFSSSGINVNGITFFDINGYITRYTDDMDFYAGFSIKNPDNIDNKVTFEGNLQYKPSLSMQLSFNADELPLSPFTEFTDKIKTGNMALSTEGFLSTDFKRYPFL